ncbi:MAG: WecB/TagA/CpsF family glycosyltransferase [Verrucomicrobiota bacterium]
MNAPETASSAPCPGVDRVNVLGVGVSALNLDRATELVIAAGRGDRKAGYVTVTGVHGVSEAQEDDGFRRILNRSYICTPDGMPLSWVGWYYGHREMDRVYGPDLMLRVFDEGRAAGLKHYFYGGREGVADQLKARLEERFPGARVVGTFCPPFRPLNEDEEAALRREIATLQPDLLWVGLSTPKQERFMAAYEHKLDVKVMLSVGAAFDFHAGLVPQAPGWMQRAGLEWLYRLVCEPRRLWKRYFKNNPLFLWRITRQLMGKRFDLDS